jgi:hypothetical protein
MSQTKIYVHSQFFTYHGPAEKAWNSHFFPVIKLSRVSCIFGNFSVFFLFSSQNAIYRMLLQLPSSQQPAAALNVLHNSSSFSPHPLRYSGWLPSCFLSPLVIVYVM